MFIDIRTAQPDRPAPPCPPWCTAQTIDEWDWTVVLLPPEVLTRA